MEFRLDEGQVELQGTVARFCADRLPVDGIVAREGAPLDRTVWKDLAELGVLGLLASDAEGGSGLGALDGAIVFEQLGSHLVPGPLVWTALAAGVVDGAASGDTVVGGALASEVVDGVALVEHAADLDVVLVVHADALTAHRTRDLPTPAALASLDPLTPVGRVTGLARGSAIGDAEAAGRFLALGTVLSAAMLAGVASRALEVARAYALEREQFDVPIGSFQAIKHLLADMYVRSGLAQSATYAAAAVLQDPGHDDPVRAASAAKLLASDAAIANASTAIQVLGGMGFTWDMLPNHLLKRAWVLEHTFGAADEHATSIGVDLLAAAG